MRIQAALASSLAFRPRLIVLDEPFSGLDGLVREQVIETILDRAPESTVFLASHDLAEIESFASHVGYLNHGRLRFVEEMAGLSDRFRTIEVILDRPVELPSDLPEKWLNVEQTSVVVRFTDSRFDNRLSEDELRRHFPSARAVTARVMPLAAIVVELMKAEKTAELTRCR